MLVTVALPLDEVRLPTGAKLADEAAALTDDTALLAEVMTGPGARGTLEERMLRRDELWWV